MIESLKDESAGLSRAPIHLAIQLYNYAAFGLFSSFLCQEDVAQPVSIGKNIWGMGRLESVQAPH